MNANWFKPITVLLLAGLAITASAEDGVTDSTILIGQTVGLTGIVAGPIKELNEGAAAYLAVINNKGGVHGRKIRILTLDDKFDPALAASNAERLIKKERVFALFQNRGTPHTEAIAPLLLANNIPLIAPSTGAAVFHTPVNRLLFNVRAKYQDEVIRAVQHFTTLGVNKIGLLHVDDSFGRDGLAGFTGAMAASKLQPVIITTFDRVKPDYAATVDTIIKANPSALIIVSSSKHTVEVIKLIRAKGHQMQISTQSNNSSQSFVDELGKAGAGVMVSQVTPAPHLVTTKLGQEFAAAAKATGATVSYAAMEGFIAAKVLVEGLRRAGPKLTRESFIRGLESIERVDLGGLMVDYNPKDHTGSEFVELTMIGRDGRFIR